MASAHAAAFIAAQYPSSPTARVSPRRLASLFDFLRVPFWRHLALRDTAPRAALAAVAHVRRQEASAWDVCVNAVAHVAVAALSLPIQLALVMRANDTTGGTTSFWAACRGVVDAARQRTEHERQRTWKPYEVRTTDSTWRLFLAHAVRPTIARVVLVRAVESVAASPLVARAIADRVLPSGASTPARRRWLARVVRVALCAGAVYATHATVAGLEASQLDAVRYTTAPVSGIADLPPVPRARLFGAVVRVATLLAS